MKKYTLILTAMAFIVAFSAKAQVAINDDGSDADATAILDINADDKGVSFPNVDIPVLGEDTPIRDAKIGLVVYNTSTTTGPGLFMWTGAPPAGEGWVNLSQQSAGSSGSFVSVSLTDDEVISSSNYTDITDMELSFIAEKAEVLVSLTASGTGFDNSMSYVALRVWNVTSANSIGGTQNKIQTSDRYNFAIFFLQEESVPSWSAAFSKKITGLSIGTEYEIKVQGLVDGVRGNPNALIDARTSPDTDHMTLTVIQ